MRPVNRPLALGGALAGETRPEPQLCPRCGAWIHPLSSELWFCPSCSLLWPPEDPARRTPTAVSLPLPLPHPNGSGSPVWVPGPRRYFDALGNEVLVLRREP